MYSLVMVTRERFYTIEIDFAFYYIYTNFLVKYTTIVCMQVDDMLIIGTHLEDIVEMKKYISLNFEMKDLG